MSKTKQDKQKKDNILSYDDTFFHELVQAGIH